MDIRKLWKRRAAYTSKLRNWLASPTRRTTTACLATIMVVIMVYYLLPIKEWIDALVKGHAFKEYLVISALVVAPLGILLAWKRIHILSEQQQTELKDVRAKTFKGSIELLNSDKAYVLQGALRSLELYAKSEAKDDIQHTLAVYRIITGFIQARTPAPPQEDSETMPAKDGSSSHGEKNGSTGEETDSLVDVRTAIAILRDNFDKELHEKYQNSKEAKRSEKKTGEGEKRLDDYYVDLSDTRFPAYTDLSNSVFRNSNFSDSILEDAVLEGINLRDANLIGTDLTDADLTGADLTEADLTEAGLTRADLTRANLTGTDLTEADLTGANLTEANLSGADLSGEDLREVILAGADLSGADLREVAITGKGLARANLRGINLREADLREAIISGADLTDANLTRADLTGAYLTGADLTGADLRKAKGLTPQQIAMCQMDDDTQLPEGLRRPENDT